jgi:hypothetical protein
VENQSERSYDAFDLWIQHLFLSPNDRLLVIVAYLDESGDPCDLNRHVFGFGGFIGRVDDWTLFADKWIDACPSEFYPFHMKDFAHKTKNDQKHQREIMESLIGVIQSSRIVPVSTICHVCDFREPGVSLTHSEGGALYNGMLGHVFTQVSVAVISAQSGGHPIPDVPHTSIVFAQRQFAGRAHDFWWKCREDGSGPLGFSLSGILLKSVSTATPDTVPPLQAADLWAWEVGHHYEVMQRKGKMRKSYELLRALPKIDGLAVPSHSVVTLHELGGGLVSL